MGTLTALAVAMGLGGSSGCHQQIVQPDPERVALTVVNVNNPCTRVAFAVTGNNSVTATMPSSTCGESPFKIVSAGTMTWKQNPNRLLKIPVRILNKDEVSVPAYYVPRIVLRPAAKVVSNPAGTTPATMVPLNPDSTRADGTAVWLMTLPDSVFVELPGAFPPRSTTNSRTLEFRINSPTIAGVFEFDLVGERFEVADSVPAVAPDSMPAWFNHDSSWTSQTFLKRVLAVSFKAGATIAQKSAAIDSVGGRVVGGIHMPDGTDGVYFIEVSDRITLVGLLAAGEVLMRQAVVDRADPYMSIRSLWRRPPHGRIEPTHPLAGGVQVEAALRWGLVGRRRHSQSSSHTINRPATNVLVWKWNRRSKERREGCRRDVSGFSRRLPMPVGSPSWDRRTPKCLRKPLHTGWSRS